MRATTLGLRGPDFAPQFRRHALVRAPTGVTCCACVDGCPILRLVRVWLDLPDAIVEQLAEKEQDLSRAALEALAIDAYRMDRMTARQLCQLLEIPSRYELDGFLKHHGVPLEFTLDDFEREERNQRATLAQATTGTGYGSRP